MRLLVAALMVGSSAAALAQVAVRVQPGVARQGDPVLITVTGADPDGEPTGTLGTKALRFHKTSFGWMALSGIPADMKPATLDLKVKLPPEGGEGSEDEAGEALEITGTLDVEDANFRKSELKVASKYIRPPKSALKQIAEDKVAFNKAWKQAPAPPAFSANFAWPRPPEVTAPYGDRRLFNGKQQSQHYGTDLNGSTGDPILAANDGVVVMARDCYASGGTVLVYHGADLFTAYFHMSKIEAKAGQKVKQGDQLGLVGKTGRVTGPHLHWGVKVEGNWVNAETLMRLDFSG